MGVNFGAPDPFEYGMPSPNPGQEPTAKHGSEEDDPSVMSSWRRRPRDASPLTEALTRLCTEREQPPVRHTLPFVGRPVRHTLPY